MPDRYYLDKNGAVTRRRQGQPGGGHVDIARDVLAENGITPKDIEDHYSQMSRLKFIRIVEHTGDLVKVEHKHKPTAGQKRYLRALEVAGKTLKYVTVKR